MIDDRGGWEPPADRTRSEAMREVRLAIELDSARRDLYQKWRPFLESKDIDLIKRASDAAKDIK